jgi:hypothetical protein
MTKQLGQEIEELTLLSQQNNFLSFRAFNFLKAFFIFPLIFQLSCALVAVRPKQEMSLAQAAFIAAQSANAPRYSPNLFRQAEVAYLQAKSAYRKKYFDKAKKYAKICIYYAERAEVESLKTQSFQANKDEGSFNESF